MSKRITMIEDPVSTRRDEQSTMPPPDASRCWSS